MGFNLSLLVGIGLLQVHKFIGINQLQGVGVKSVPSRVLNGLFGEFGLFGHGAFPLIGFIER